MPKPDRTGAFFDRGIYNLPTMNHVFSTSGNGGTIGCTDCYYPAKKMLFIQTNTPYEEFSCISLSVLKSNDALRFSVADHEILYP